MNILQHSLNILGENLHSNLTRHLGEVLQQQGLSTDSSWCPSVDIVETVDALLIQILMPGVSEDSLDVSFYNNIITVKGIRSQPELYGTLDLVKRKEEIIWGAVTRKVMLPLCVTSKKGVTVEFKNGVLSIDIDKTVEESNKFSMKVNS